MTTRAISAVLQRQYLFFFIQHVFSELHPDDTFVPNWHVLAMCVALEDVYAGRKKRLLITVPPRHLKSICTTIGFSAWMLGRRPTSKLMVASYSMSLTQEHSRHFRQVIGSNWYKALFAHMRINSRVDRADEVATTKSGGRMAVSRGGSATGRGADILIVDDLNKADDASSPVEREGVIRFFRETLLSRLNDKENGAVIVIQQRVHEDDLPGYLIAQGGYHHLNLPAIAQEPGSFDIGFGKVHHRAIGDILMPQRENAETLEALRVEMSPGSFNAQYLQNPVLPGANAVRWEWFEHYENLPDRNQFQFVIQSWDTGMSADPASDFSVCLTFGLRGGKWWLLDMYRRQRDFPDLVPDAERLARDWSPDKIIIENAAAGKPLFQELRQRLGRSEMIVHATPKGTKEERLRAQSHHLAEGGLILPDQAPWLETFRHELLGFPNAKNDDVVDALSQGLKFMFGRGGRLLRATDPVTGRRNIERRRSARR